DVKESNIMVNPFDIHSDYIFQLLNPTYKLIDFGMATKHPGKITHTILSGPLCVLGRTLGFVRLWTHRRAWRPETHTLRANGRTTPLTSMDADLVRPQAHKKQGSGLASMIAHLVHP